VSRFDCPSGPLDLGNLIARSRKALWLAFSIAVLIHLGITQVKISQEESKAIRPLTTKFIKREPRLVKPLELKKRPKPKPRPMRRKVVTVKAKVSRREMFRTATPTMRVLDSLARPRGKVARTVPFEPVRLERYVGSAVIEGDREPEEKIDMELEMLDIEALDTGRYKAMVIQDPVDRRKIKGFARLGVVYCIRQKNLTMFQLPIQLVRKVIVAMNKLTGVRTEMAGYYAFDSEELLKVPWVFFNIEGSAFELARSEAMNLGRYLTGGGFIFAETGWAHNWTQTGGEHFGELMSVRNMIRDALATVGKQQDRNWMFEVLSPDHPIYHSYFDFDRAPPTWKADSPEEWSAKGSDPVRGINVEGRLAGLVETGDYERWINAEDSVRHKQFFVNTIIFALTQEGSITQQVMSHVE